MQRLTILLLSLLLLNGCTTLTQVRLDAEVDRRCREDGGLKIYETVPTPPEKFDKYDLLKFYNMSLREDALGPDYKFIYTNTFYQGGNGPPNGTGPLVSPTMWRTHIQVIRRADNKLLGESIEYNRYGADPGWAVAYASGAPETSYGCPKKGTGVEILLEKIFINSGKAGGKQ